MKRIIFMLYFSLITTSVAFAEFTDIKYSWYRNAILDLQQQGLANGYGDGRFGPENSVTRAEILAILLRASKITLTEIGTEKCFPDVDPNMWYHTYICNAYKMGIANGFDDGKFRPNNPVTTLEALAFGNKVFDLSIMTIGNPWYSELQIFAEQNNILPTHSYTISTNISRGKSAELITRLQEFKRTNIPPSYKSMGCTVSAGIISGEQTLTIEGKERKYNLFVPSGYTNNREYSLIIATHGRTNSKDQVQAYMGLDRASNNESIIVYPAALPTSSGSGFSWSEKEHMTFIDAILRNITEHFCINRDNIYLVGHSLGGWMAQRIACLRGEFVSGLAVVGSGPYTGDCSGPVPTLFFQNTNDHLSSYASGVSAKNTRLKTNACDESVTENIQIGNLTCTKYSSCSQGNSIIWCEGYTGYNGDPHSWPTPNGGRDIWKFLQN